MKIKGTIESRYRTKTFADQTELDKHIEDIYNKVNRDKNGDLLPTGWYAREELRNVYPERFPCLMIYDPEPRDNRDGPRIIENFFIYEFEIL